MSEVVPGQQALPPLIELAVKYGVALVLCFVVIAILVWVLRWVFRTTKDREEAMATIVNTGLKGLTEAITNLTDAVKALRHELKSDIEMLKESARYQREEHEAMRKELRDRDCKAA